MHLSTSAVLVAVAAICANAGVSSSLGMRASRPPLCPHCPSRSCIFRSSPGEALLTDWVISHISRSAEYLGTDTLCSQPPARFEQSLG